MKIAKRNDYQEPLDAPEGQKLLSTPPQAVESTQLNRINNNKAMRGVYALAVKEQRRNYSLLRAK